MNGPVVEHLKKNNSITLHIRNHATHLICFVIAALSLLTPAQASNFKWIEPTASELAMTSYAKAPDAPAVILLYDETDDATSAEVWVHVRVKVLKEGGFTAATVELPERIIDNGQSDHGIFARTIHPNGSIVPFTGQPFEQAGDTGRISEIITLPDVTVGSILEYGYHLNSLNNLNTHYYGTYAPIWPVQQKYFVCAAHFHLNTADIEPKSVRWVTNLPEGAQIKQIKHHVELDVTDVAALPDEEFMPPADSVRYRIRFFYWDRTREDYWGDTANRINNYWKDFYQPSKTLTASVNQIIAPTDTDEQKLHKLYDAVMALENTDLMRERSRREDKASGIKEAKKSEDIWRNKRGGSDDLALLYVALARAAGFQAYPMAVTTRYGANLDLDLLSWDQMDDIIAIVYINGHTIFLDPGTRDCSFGHLAWWHANVGGVSFEGKQLKAHNTPPESTSSAQTLRFADVKLDPQDNIDGTISITWIKNAGLSLRRQFLRQDQQSVETTVTNDIQHDVPEGVQLKLTSLKGLEAYNDPLVAIFSVSGKLGTLTGRRIFLPAEFFANSNKLILSAQTRALSISFPQPYFEQDSTRITLPASMAIEALPKAKTLEIAKDTGYQVLPPTTDGNVVLIRRAFFLKRLDYEARDYNELHKYFGEIADSDKDTVVLQTIAKQ